VGKDLAKARRQAALFHSRKQRRSREALAPHNSVGPVITGDFIEGEELSVSDGTWTGSPTFTYQWLRGPSLNKLVDIAGADADTYTLTADDVDLIVTCAVIATNDFGVRSHKAAGAVVEAA